MFLSETATEVWPTFFCLLSVRHFVEHLDDDFHNLSLFLFRVLSPGSSLFFIHQEMDKLLENHQFATHAIAASASVSLGTALAYPLDTIKTIIQVGSGPTKKLTPSQVVNRVLRVSGYSGHHSFVFIQFFEMLASGKRWCLCLPWNTNAGLYSGLGWLTLGRISGVGARFGVYEILTAFYKGTNSVLKFSSS